MGLSNNSESESRLRDCNASPQSRTRGKGHADIIKGNNAAVHDV